MQRSFRVEGTTLNGSNIPGMEAVSRIQVTKASLSRGGGGEERGSIGAFIPLSSFQKADRK